MLFTLFLLVNFSAIGQTILPFVDFNDFFRVWQDGAFRQIEFQPIIEYKTADEFVAYIDTRGNLRIYDGKKIKDLANTNIEYRLSDHFLTWKISTTLNLWDAGKLQTLSYNADQYEVMDSMVVYHDLRYNNVTVYEKGVKTVVYQSTGELAMPLSIGDNTFAYKDNGDFFKVYWKGQSYDIDVWVGKMDFSAGVDVVAWNDPNTRTFAVFEKGLITDVEDFYAKSFKAGRGFVVYEDLNGNLIKFQNGVKKQLSKFNADVYYVKDDIVCWSENGYFYMESKGKKWQISNFLPQDIVMKNDVLVYKNIMNGVSVSHNGKIEDITNQIDASYEIVGSSVIVRLFNRSFIVWSEGRKYEP
ncbi:MAG: hypothetical protein KJ941_02595 [Bacteroidetes bacterium]|nr:hypothetical protein [Bacteroidota bacterium]